MCPCGHPVRGRREAGLGHRVTLLSEGNRADYTQLSACLLYNSFPPASCKAHLLTHIHHNFLHVPCWLCRNDLPAVLHCALYVSTYNHVYIYIQYSGCLGSTENANNCVGMYILFIGHPILYKGGNVAHSISRATGTIDSTQYHTYMGWGVYLIDKPVLCVV